MHRRSAVRAATYTDGPPAPTATSPAIDDTAAGYHARMRRSLSTWACCAAAAAALGLLALLTSRGHGLSHDVGVAGAALFYLPILALLAIGVIALVRRTQA